MEAFLKVSSTTVKPPNKRHVAGDKLYINSHALSLVERLFSFQRVPLLLYIGKWIFLGPMNCPL